MPKSSVRKVLFGVLGIVTVFYGCFFLIGLMVWTSNREPVPIKAGRYEAHDVAKQFVRDRLKAPATAAFASIDADRTWIREDEPGIFTVKSYVDAQNSFGANLRTWYLCRVRSTGGKNFVLVDLTVLPK